MRKFSVVMAVSLPLAAWQTSVSTTYTRDVNGQSIPGAIYSSSKDNGNSASTEYMMSVNGRKVPLESTEERVVRQDSAGSVVERVIRRYDPNGNPGPVERQKIETRNNPDGSVSSTTNVYRSDLNGRLELAERIVAEGSKAGVTVTTNTVVERPTLNGSVQVEERRVRTETTDPAGTKSDTMTYRKDPSGRFVEALRVIADAKDQNGQTVQNVANYEPGDTGKLQLHSQTVTRSRKNADGTTSSEVDIFRHVPGRAESTGTPRLTERQTIEQRLDGDRVVERKSAQRPTISDPDRLGPSELIGERVCTGKCKI